uniref:Hemerythrin n=4 Tax=Bilateria TaxID=33213 RepID=A0A1S6QCD4_9ANNE|nr:hemerythrin [Aphrodita japonica]AQV13604.1 hemerythrin [Boccardia proboscidea]AQV13771.1 hemerythrin [Themiste pyroides]ASW22301.1 hemerythrin [Stereobalanus canadensis]
MGFDIPEPYVWDESFRVFYETLDTEHKGLFQGIFACIGENSQGNLDTLRDKVEKHFSTEEGMMKKNNYADYESHKKLHAEFVGKLAALSAPLDGPSVDYAKNWLVNHIKGIDFKYKGKLG